MARLRCRSLAPLQRGPKTSYSSIGYWPRPSIAAPTGESTRVTQSLSLQLQPSSIQTDPNRFRIHVFKLISCHKNHKVREGCASSAMRCESGGIPLCMRDTRCATLNLSVDILEVSVSQRKDKIMAAGRPRKYPSRSSAATIEALASSKRP